MTGSPARPLSQAAECRFRQILRAEGSIELPIHEADRAPELSELVEYGLLAPFDDYEADPPVRVLTAVDPANAQDRWATRLREQAAFQFGALCTPELESDSLVEAYDQHPPLSSSPAGFEQVVGRRAINQRIGQIAAGCTREVLTLAPGPRPPARALQSVLRRDLAIAQRVTWKTLYEPTVLADEDLQVYVEAMSQAGARFRTSEQLTGRLFIVDHTTAVVPATSLNGTLAACFITDPPCVAYLRGVFLHLWDRARPWQAHGVAVPLSGLQQRIGALLLEGLDQADMAAELKMNERTLAGHIAHLKVRLGAKTLYQLGAALHRSEPL
jgi:DNA-binding CsgD family transcriptional regulator